jgi:hypothetical protein
MSVKIGIGEGYDEWKEKYDGYCGILTNQPNIETLRANHPIQREIGLKLLTVQLAQLAYSQSVELPASDEALSVSDDNVSQQRERDKGDLHQATAPFNITTSHQKLFAYLQIRCNELFKELGKSGLPLLRLTPLMLIDLQTQADSKKIDRESDASPTSLENIASAIENVATEGSKGVSASRLSGSKKKKQKSKKKKKKSSKAPHVNNLCSEDGVELVLDPQHAREKSSCIEGVDDEQVDQVDEESVDLVADDDSTKSSHHSEDEMTTFLSSTCRSLSSQTIAELLQLLPMSSDRSSGSAALIKLLASSYEDVIFKRTEAYEEKVQMLYMRLFIAETNFENEKESLLKQIEVLRSSTTPT